mmetsp:Transcript_38578/g.89665  ORF Transcript_38578/g.89665 Transcript_38578/m.89665 type:complete len:187 (-) Transcript_38578:176-736(-)
MSSNCFPLIGFLRLLFLTVILQAFIVESFLQDVNIMRFNITTTDYDIPFAYHVKACRCLPDFTSCDPSPPDLRQNGLIHICIYPSSTDVVISNFNMTFFQNNSNVMTAISMGETGPVSNSISAVRGYGTVEKKYKVISRLVTRLFISGIETFDIIGSAYLNFIESDREPLVVNFQSFFKMHPLRIL